MNQQTPPTRPGSKPQRPNHQAKATLVKSLVAVATLASFGGGVAMLAHETTEAAASTADAGLISNTPATGTNVPGLGSPDASGFFAFGDDNQGVASPTTSANDGSTTNDNSTTTPQPRVRSRSS
jgi:hypothetical protein